MTCSKCGLKDRDGIKFCSECGTAFSRGVQKGAREFDSFDWMWGVGGVVGFLAVALVLIWALREPTISKTPVSELRRTEPEEGRRSGAGFRVSGAMACASTLDDAAPLAEAYLHGDPEAVSGLIARRKAIPLESGTRVAVLVADSPFRGMHALYVESGFYVGEKCYGLGSFLKR